MNPTDDFVQQITRRHFFGQSGLGLGTAALASLLGGDHRLATPNRQGIDGVPHFAPKAKRAIWLFMAARSALFIRRFAGHRWQVVGAER